MNNTPVSYGFYQPDLNIEIIECIDVKIDPILPIVIKGFYRMFYILDGKFDIITKDKTFTAEKGTLLISDKNSYFNTKRLTTSATCLNIYIQESALQEFLKYNIFEVFHKLPFATPIYPATFNNEICFNILNSMKEALNKHYNEYYIKTKVITILSELDLFYNSFKKEDVFDKTNLTLKVIDFVQQNYNSQITYKILKDKFFISDNTVNKIFKQQTGKTFKDYLNDLRLKHANDLMNNKYQKISLNNVAKLCGFSTYSTFYREYIKKYKVSPREVQKANIEKWKNLN